MTINSLLSTIEPKKQKLSKQLGQEQTREMETVTYKGVPIRLLADFSTETLQARGARKKYSKSWKARTYNLDYSIQQSYHLGWKGFQIKCFPDKVKLKEFIITKALLYEMLKGPI